MGIYPQVDSSTFEHEALRDFEGTFFGESDMQEDTTIRLRSHASFHENSHDLSFREA